MDYHAYMQQLPPPSAEQIAAFADHVSEAHSWYKHLPLAPPRPFYFYLDPNAGRATVHLAAGETAFVDITDQKEIFHYSTNLTSVYRQGFGYWAYEAPYGTRVYAGSPGRWVTTEQTGASTPELAFGQSQHHLAVFTAEHGWLNVPDGLVSLGTVPVTALIHPDRNPRLSWVTTDTHWRVKYPAYLQHTLEDVPDDVLAALRAHYDFEQSETYQTARQTHQNLYPELDSWGEYQKWQETAIAQQADELSRQVEAAMERERQRQLSVMRAAMRALVAAIYGEVRS